MKTLFLTFGLLLTTLSFSQKIIIHVFEKQEMVSYSKTSIDSVLSYPDEVGDLDLNHTIYNIDLNEETSTYFFNGEEISKLPIKFEDLGYGVIKVNIVEGDFDYGLIINTQTESVVWFWFTDEMTTVRKITRFYFEKSS
jgi:hypothetical protein